MTSLFLDALERIAQLRIVVIGDLMLDHYITGTTERTSPEAPVPVVLVKQESFFAGGAANVARNIAATGATVRCVGTTGNDPAGLRLRQELEEAGVLIDTVLTSDENSTIVKARIVSQGQQIVRLDYEQPYSASVSGAVDSTSAIARAIQQADAVVLSDYGKGFLSPPLLQQIVELCSLRNIRIFVDPKGQDYSRYRGAYAITPNSREAREATGFPTSEQPGLLQAAKAIRDVTDGSLVVITRGAEGLALLDESGALLEVPTSAREVFDVTGAGDTFVAWLALGVTAGLLPADAARLANTAAGVAIARIGPATVTPFDLKQALAPGRLGQKLICAADLAILGEQLRARGRRIVLANGCFDFLHAGHVAFLQQAKALGDVLILATNNDETISRLKGEGRPVIPQRQREELLASIEAVDYVTVFQEDTPHEVIRQLRPDVLVKGSNYTATEVEGADLMRTQGGEIALLPLVHNISTSDLVRRLH